jgi:hypothetical protein
MTNMFGMQEIDIPFSNFLHRDTATQVSLQIMRHSEAFDIEQQLTQGNLSNFCLIISNLLRIFIHEIGCPAINSMSNASL